MYLYNLTAPEQTAVVIGPNNSPINRLGRRLRALRTANGRDWTLADVERGYGIDKGNLSRIERGESSPSLATLHKLRTAYAVDDETFLTWLDMLAGRSRADVA